MSARMLFESNTFGAGTVYVNVSVECMPNKKILISYISRQLSRFTRTYCIFSRPVFSADLS